jgi:hypothetical protein
MVAQHAECLADASVTCQTAFPMNAARPVSKGSQAPFSVIRVMRMAVVSPSVWSLEVRDSTVPGSGLSVGTVGCNSRLPGEA